MRPKPHISPNRRAQRCIVQFATLVCGCTSFKPPEGYVRDTSAHDYDVRAVSARGSVIAYKSRANDNRDADLTYWTQAIEYQKIDLDGMKLAAREDMKSDSGVNGVLFTFETGEGQGKSAYLVALYVTPWNIHTVEATGPAESVGKDMEKLRVAMRSVP